MSGVVQAPRRAIGDMKEGLTTARPKLSIIGQHAQTYTCRGMEYGGDKYCRGNYYGAPPAEVTPVERFMGYVDAAMRHLTKIAQAFNIAHGTGGNQAAACSVVDDEASANFPPSMLPHMAHALASLMIGTEVGVMDGLLPADPGQPWTKHSMYADVLKRRGGQADIPQKDDPDAERARVEALASSKADAEYAARDLQAIRDDFEREFEEHERILLEKKVADGGFDIAPATPLATRTDDTIAKPHANVLGDAYWEDMRFVTPRSDTLR